MILKKPWPQAIILLFLFIGAYWLPLKGIVNTWMTNDDYSYGFLIPVISVYLGWEMRARLRGLEIRGSWPVLPVLLVFFLLSIYGILGSSQNISRPVIPVLIILFTAFCFGVELTKRFILPLGFLIFMVPLPAILDRTFGVFLKRISSDMGGMFVRMCGIPVHVSGNLIDLGVTQLQVVDACSGLRFVFPLFALGIIYAYFFERVLWKQVVCVLSTIPIAILTNVIRIGITGILTVLWDPEAAQGFFHDFSGWAIFMVAFVFLFLLGRFLSLFPPKDHRISKRGLSETNGSTDHIRVSGDNAPFFVSILLLLIVGGFSWTTSKLPPLEIKGGMESFPLAFGNWKGYSVPVDSEIVEKSGAEAAFSAVYRNRSGEEVSLYVGYRKSAFLENENFFHSPTVCLPASGWETRDISTRKIANVPVFQNITVTKMVAKHMDVRELVYFWFQTKDKATPDKNIHRFHLTIHAIQRDNTHALFIRPITQIGSRENLQDAEERMDGFVREMLAALTLFLKENQFENTNPNNKVN